MSLWDAILINGVHIPDELPPEVRAGTCVEGPWEWPYMGAGQRGDFPVFQGFDGAGYISQPYQVNVLPFYVTLSAPPCSGDTITQSNETFAWLNHAFETIREVCQPDQPSVLTRRRSLSPYSTDESHTANAKLLNITPARPGRDTLKLVVEFSLLDGCWFGPEVTETLSEGTHTITVPGDTRTHAIVATLDPALDNDAMSILNNRNGYAFDLLQPGAYGGDTFDVDVLARTANRVVGGAADVSRYLTWSKKHPLRLDPGPNELVLGSDTVLTYAPAYL